MTMFLSILIIIGLTLMPLLELRASIPYGILATDLHWSLVFLIAVAANAVLGPLVYLFIDKLIHHFFHIRWFHKWYHAHVEITQKRIHKSIEKYGEWGIALFIGVPLPGTGSYSGALGSYLLGLSYKKFIIANLLGVIIAGIIVTIITFSGNGIFHLFIKLL